MKIERYVRLLYCEDQKCFHYDDVTSGYTMGDQYRVVDWCVSETVASKFTNDVYKLQEKTLFASSFELIMFLYATTVVIPAISHTTKKVA